MGPESQKDPHTVVGTIGEQMGRDSLCGTSKLSSREQFYRGDPGLIWERDIFRASVGLHAHGKQRIDVLGELRAGAGTRKRISQIGAGAKPAIGR